MDKTDRRVSKTLKALKNALIVLIEEKELRKITVSDITKEANINRGTFYLHYLDIYDMVEKLEDEIINKIKKIVDSGNTLATNYLYLPTLVKIIEYFY
jgi:AcrR family transcriptional regulator